jgi:Protein of unknown function (DUF3619)
MTNSYQSQANSPLDIVGLNIAGRLSESANHLPHDISERLKAARVQALMKRKVVAQLMPVAASASGVEMTINTGDDDRSLWIRIASLLPLLALIAGLMVIGVLAEEKRSNELAEIDVEILTGELPPAAYTDPGFAQFLRVNHGE